MPKRKDSEAERYNVVQDSPEMIQQCLNCTKARCTNCFDRGGRLEKRKEEVRKRREAEIDKFLEGWIIGRTDDEIAKQLGKGKGSVYHTRIRIGFPSAGAFSEEEKRRMVDEWKKKRSEQSLAQSPAT